MERIDLVISLLALGGCLFTYLYHDRKLKKQERLIQEYAIHKIEAEKENDKKAAVRANCLPGRSGNRTIKIFNSGKAKATNIRLQFAPSDVTEWIRVEGFPFPYLNPQDNTEIFALVYEGMPSFEIKMIWDDEFNKDNEYSQILSL